MTPVTNEPKQSGVMRRATPQQHFVCVDLDGTLLASDILWESLILLIRTRPSRLFRLLFWLVRGKAHFKRQLAQCVKPNPELLPYRQNFGRIPFPGKLSFPRRAIELSRMCRGEQQWMTSVAAHLTSLSPCEPRRIVNQPICIDPNVEASTKNISR